MRLGQASRCPSRRISHVASANSTTRSSGRCAAIFPMSAATRTRTRSTAGIFTTPYSILDDWQSMATSAPNDCSASRSISASRPPITSITNGRSSTRSPTFRSSSKPATIRVSARPTSTVSTPMSCSRRSS
ncbi:hypothetical protein DAI00_19740 [Sphingomonas koreensis]|nr:hypothetical protein DAI00_19740 [Sphingomonas koreensis]